MQDTGWPVCPEEYHLLFDGQHLILSFASCSSTADQPVQAPCTCPKVHVMFDIHYYSAVHLLAQCGEMMGLSACEALHNSY